MDLVPKNKSKGGKRQSSRIGKGRQVGSGATRSAHPKLVWQKQLVSPEGADTILPYGQSYYLSSGGIYQYYQFRLNSANDFDYTSTGEQPDGYDQWTAFFTLYKVYKTEIEVTIIPTTKALACVFYVSPNTTGATTLENALSQKVSKFVTCGVYETKTLRHTVVMPNFFGADYSEFGSSLYGASVGSNPAAVCYGTVDVFNIDGSATVSCYIVVKAKLWVQFTSPGYLAISFRDDKLSKEKSTQPPEEAPKTGALTSVNKPKRTFHQILEEFDLVDR
jgi:hypothetical protein